MSSPSGLAGQFGYTSETTVGTAVTVASFLPVNSVKVKQDIERLDSMGIRAGRVVTSSWKPGKQTISGSVEMELWNADIASLLRHCFGSVSTTGSNPYYHTFTPGVLTGLSMTMQAGKPDVGGTVRPFTWAGCKVSKWELKATAGELAMMSLDVVGMTETTGTALASASYDSALAPFTFANALLSIGGSQVDTVKSVSLTGDSNLTDRFRLGSATSIEYLENGFRDYSGTLTADFEDLTHYNRFINGTEAALVLVFNNGTDSLTVTTNVRFNGESPELAGPEILEQPLPFKCVSATSDASAITAVLVNTDQFATN